MQDASATTPAARPARRRKPEPEPQQRTWGRVSAELESVAPVNGRLLVVEKTPTSAKVSLCAPWLILWPFLVALLGWHPAVLQALTWLKAHFGF